MKLLILIFLVGFIFSCKPDRELRTGLEARATEPAYIKDRMTEDYSSSRTNSQGATGPGVGTSESANFYRKEAMRALSDTTTRDEDLLPGIIEEQHSDDNFRDSVQYDEVPW